MSINIKKIFQLRLEETELFNLRKSLYTLLFKINNENEYTFIDDLTNSEIGTLEHLYDIISEKTNG